MLPIVKSTFILLVGSGAQLVSLPSTSSDHWPTNSFCPMPVSCTVSCRLCPPLLFANSPQKPTWPPVVLYCTSAVCGPLPKLVSTPWKKGEAYFQL